jgi:hypothetical protein
MLVSCVRYVVNLLDPNHHPSFINYSCSASSSSLLLLFVISSLIHLTSLSCTSHLPYSFPPVQMPPQCYYQSISTQLINQTHIIIIIIIIIFVLCHVLSSPKPPMPSCASLHSFFYLSHFHAYYARSLPLHSHCY